MSKNTHRWVIPESHMKTLGEEPKMANGDPFVESMTGAMFHSSLELGTNVQPQYTNGRDCLCQVDPELMSVFKPEFADGEFGAVTKDEVQPQYQVDLARTVFEVTSEKQAVEMAQSLKNNSEFISILENNLTYATKDGKTLSYREAVELRKTWREHNSLIQGEIDSFLADAGYAPKIDHNGKAIRKKYPESILETVRSKAAAKKTVTPMNLIVTIVGKHTISKNDNYVVANGESLAEFKNTRYKEKESFSVGQIRSSSIVIPIQSCAQLALVMKTIKALGGSLAPTSWVESKDAINGDTLVWGTEYINLVKKPRS